MPFLVISCREVDVTLSIELGADLPIEEFLVGIHSQNAVVQPGIAFQIAHSLTLAQDFKPCQKQQASSRDADAHEPAGIRDRLAEDD